MDDRWSYLRKDLFRNVEPAVELVAATKPVGKWVELCSTETLPAFTSRASRESTGTKEDDLRLNRDLIKWGHTTPFQSVCFVFYISGISKSLQAQFTRHKIGVGWTFRSSRYVPADQSNFVYCSYDYIDGEERVRQLLAIDEAVAKSAINIFMEKRGLGATKEDARKIMPVFFETPCFFYVNARALRHFFSLRLEKNAEWEIRRMARMMLGLVMKETLSLFEDFGNQVTRQKEV